MHELTVALKGASYSILIGEGLLENAARRAPIMGAEVALGHSKARGR